jgi:hypothetical protein
LQFIGGGRIFEIGDEKLLHPCTWNSNYALNFSFRCGVQTLSTKPANIAIILTRYDKLVRTKEYDLESKYNLPSEELGKKNTEKSQAVDDACLQSVKQATDCLNVSMPCCTEVSSITSQLSTWSPPHLFLARRTYLWGYCLFLDWRHPRSCQRMAGRWRMDNVGDGITKKSPCPTRCVYQVSATALLKSCHLFTSSVFDKLRESYETCRLFLLIT